VLSGLLLAAMAAAIIAAVSWFDVSLNDGVGKHEYIPNSAAAAASSYKLGVGDLRIDLTQMGPITSPLRIKAHVGVGDLRVVVPQGVPVVIDGHVKLGDIKAFDQDISGHDVGLHDGSGLLTIDGHVGLGEIHVERAG
jgi:hypothetical protein